MGEQQMPDTMQEGLSAQQAAAYHHEQAQVQSAQFTATNFEAQPPATEQSWGNGRC